MAESNFKQFDSTKNNMQTDSAYELSSYRKSGAVAGRAPSATHNKLYYQTSTFIAAFAAMMAAKGYEMSDSDITTLQANLAYVMTAADMTPYALTTALANYIAKAAVVVKTDNYIITTSDFFKTIEANKATAISFTLPLYSDIDAALGTGKGWIKIKNIGAGTLTLIGTVDGEVNPTLAQNDEVSVFSDGTALRGKIISSFDSSQFINILSTSGYQKIPGTGGTLVLQWGEVDVDPETIGSAKQVDVWFPTEFANACLFVSLTIQQDAAYGGSVSPYYKSLAADKMTIGVDENTWSGPSTVTVKWFVIGY